MAVSPDYEPWRQHLAGQRSVLACPLRVGASVIGALAIASALAMTFTTDWSNPYAFYDFVGAGLLPLAFTGDTTAVAVVGLAVWGLVWAVAVSNRSYPV